MPRIRIRPRNVSRSNHGLARWDLNASKQIIDFVFVQRCFQRHEQVRPSDVAIVLRDLVFQNQMVSKCVPRKFGDQPVVLVGIAAPVGEDEIWIYLILHLLEEILHLAAAVRQKAVA